VFYVDWSGAILGKAWSGPSAKPHPKVAVSRTGGRATRLSERTVGRCACELVHDWAVG